MEEGKREADVHLSNWYEIMASDNPLRRVVWVAGGARQNESMVVHHLRVMQDDLLAANPKIESSLYTNCLDVEGWRNSYVVPHETAASKLDHIFQIQTHITCAMYQEEGLTADLYITNGLASAWAIYGHGMALWRRPLPPVIAVMAKAPEELWDYVTPEAAEFMLASMARSETFWVFTLDSANEERIMRKLMAAAGHPLFPRIRRAKSYSWQDRRPWRGKEDVVVWSGRASKMKNPSMAAEVFALLPNIRKEVFLSREAGQMSAEHKSMLAIENLRVHAGEPPEIYRALTRKAKVLLITSHAEGLPAGFIELMGQGCVPVVWNRPWTHDVIPADWPLRFDSVGEAAEKVLDALQNYPSYSKKLRRWMKRRFGAPLNFADLVSEVWRDYTIKLGDRIRVLSERGDRRSL